MDIPFPTSEVKTLELSVHPTFKIPHFNFSSTSSLRIYKFHSQLNEKGDFEQMKDDYVSYMQASIVFFAQLRSKDSCAIA